MQNISRYDTAKEIVKICSENGWKVSAAESCTGGMISADITAVSGSSAVIELGICSYSNRIKHEVLGVSEETLERFTEYSFECAEEMAKGALKVSGADFAVSTTGVAGPTGGTEENPVGTVYICACGKDITQTERFQFGTEDRAKNRDLAAKAALDMLLNIIKDKEERGK